MSSVDVSVHDGVVDAARLNPDGPVVREIVAQFAQRKSPAEVAEAVGLGLSAADVLFVVKDFLSHDVLSELERKQLLLQQGHVLLEKLFARINEKMQFDNRGGVGLDAQYFNNAIQIWEKLTTRYERMSDQVEEQIAVLRGQLGRQVVDIMLGVADEFAEEYGIDQGEARERVQGLCLKYARIADGVAQ